MGDMQFDQNSIALPRQLEASFSARSELMGKLSELIKHQGWTQKEAAAKLGVTQPRISDLTRGKIELFSLDTLVDMAAVAGMKPHIVLAEGVHI
jgi:predicted XRE-type DNA-binding protein